MKSAKVLTGKFFERSTLLVARELLGKYLCRRYHGKTIRLMITEVEAYDGPKDKASHAFRGLTPRTKVMFGPAGYWYVYFTYGMHFMLNIVTGKKGYPAAILIRGVEGIGGPARVTRAFHINGKLNNKKATRTSGIWIEDEEVKIPPSRIKKGPRVGVAYAGPVWSKKKYRFLLKTKILNIIHVLKP
ncbi:MAG: DNA-3-methyladenine glycosylase [Patescibacteria group bacterium]|nr:DNA-3-methyladenine glycosylase [Patescibacteria group bacterium]